MRVWVEPAKRNGNQKLIHAEALSEECLSWEGDDLSITFEADGMYDGSRYRYTVSVRPDEIEVLKQFARQPSADETDGKH